MKTVVNNISNREIKFPCLMKNKSGEIALFNSPTSGMILDVAETADKVGYYCDEWFIDNWTPLLPGESVTLIQE